jgi:hypothetical protein
MVNWQERLGAWGWQLARPFDICWLDCPEPGYLLTWRGLSICLCLPHAVKLQAGSFGGDYAGAPLPAESIATSWPWQPGDWGEISEAA